MSFFTSFISSSKLFSNWFLFSAPTLRLTPVNSFIVLKYKVWSMLNSSSSILPFLNALGKLVSNTAIADITMSVNFVTSVSFFSYFYVSAVVTPLRLAPARDTAPNGMLTGRPMNVLNVATLDIPVATLNPLAQAFNVTRRFNVLVYFSYFFLYLSSSFDNSCRLFWIVLKWWATWGSSGADGIDGYIL